MRGARRLAVTVGVFLVVSGLATPALAQDETVCTDLVEASYTDVRFDTAVRDWVVHEVTLHLDDGCDGRLAGMRFLLDDGAAIPPETEDPLLVVADGDIAVFDLTGLGAEVRPIVGIEVFLELEVVDVVSVPPAIAPEQVPPDVAPPDLPAILPLEIGEEPTEVLTRVLALTGLDVGQLAGLGLVALLVGTLLIVRRARRSTG